MGQYSHKSLLRTPTAHYHFRVVDVKCGFYTLTHRRTLYGFLYLVNEPLFVHSSTYYYVGTHPTNALSHVRLLVVYTAPETDLCVVQKLTHTAARPCISLL